MKRFLFFLFLTTSVYAQHKTVSIIQYGAKPDAVTNNAVFIQKAIDEVTAAGGGTVVIPAGVFVTGSIELKSGVELHLQKGAVLQGSVLRKDYDNNIHPALIVASAKQHFSITGKGIIDGKGRELMKDIFKRLEEGTMVDKEWKTKRPTEGTRTNIFFFADCNNIIVTGVTIKDATNWVTHYERCRNIRIDSIKIESVAYWNNDGIDMVDCKNVHISNCNINTADDAICLKSAKEDDYCDSIYVTNCMLRSSANAFKLGTASKGGFRNIIVRNLVVYDTYRSAIALEAVDGGFIENVDVRNVTAKNTGNAVFIKLGHRNNDNRYSTVKNIYISNIKVEVPAGKPDAGYEMEGPLLRYPPSVKPTEGNLISVSPWNYSYKDSTAVIYNHNVFPSSISGLPGHAVENVKMENIEIVYYTKADKKINYFPLDSFQLITEAEKDYPEFSMFGELPVWGFYVRHVNGLQMKNVSVKMKGTDFRTAYLFNDVKDLYLQKVNSEGSTANPQLFKHNVTEKTKQKK